MNKYATKESLCLAYAEQFDDREIGMMVAKTKAIYAPHLCRSGWIIEGFGYSTEREVSHG